MGQKDHKCLYSPCPICQIEAGDLSGVEEITPRIKKRHDTTDREPDDLEIDEALDILWRRTHDDDDDDAS